MRNRVYLMSLLLCLLGAPALVLGQAAVPGKIGIINNIQEAIFATEEGKKALADLQKKFQPRQDDLQRQQQEIQALNEQLQKQAATLSDEERVRLSRDLEDKQKVFKRATEDFNAEVQGDREDALRRIGRKMMVVLNEYARQNGFSIVVDAAQINVYYASPEIDLTAEIIRRFNAANPVDTGATTGTPTATPAATRPAASPPKPAATTKPADQPKP
jgi:Skp family chaperone for outer membrane proteins